MPDDGQREQAHLTTLGAESSKGSQGVDELSIVIPVFNEGKNFSHLWSEVTTHIKSPFHAYLVYDFDEDDTVPAAQKVIAQGDPRLSLVKNDIGRGVVGAIRTGFNQISTGPCIVVMADLSDDLKQVDQMVELYRKGNHIIAGSRYMPGGKIEGSAFLKQLMSRMAGLTLFWLRGIPTHDATNAFKLYDVELLKKIQIESQGGFELSLEITVKAFLAGYKIAEIPTTWRDRTEGESKFRLWAWLPSYLKWYFFAFQPKKSKQSP